MLSMDVMLTVLLLHSLDMSMFLSVHRCMYSSVMVSMGDLDQL